MSFDLLLEMAWKSGLVAGAALIGASLLRSRPPAERVAVLRLGVVMLLALPLLAALMPAVRIQAPAFPAPTERTAGPAVAIPAPPPALTAAPSRTIDPLPARPPANQPAWRIDPVAAGLAVWAAGFGFLALRLFAGVALLNRWTRRAEPVADTRWLAALERASQGRRAPVLRVSPRVTSPLSWGWRPAIILLDPAALDQAGRADAVLAHEMGHVRHGDWMFLMLSRLLAAALWFNPLVWLLQRELARQSEQAADAWAADRIGRADYASALVAMAARGRPHAALGMAAPRGELARRVIAVMTASSRRGRPWRTALSIAACVGFATPLAAVELAPEALAEVLPSGPRPAGPVGTRAASPSEAAAAAFAPARAVRPGAPPIPPAELATALRQRDQGLALMEAGARLMETRAQEMRQIAAGLDAEDRASLIADADDLVRESAELRAEARELAARDPATLRPLSPEDEHELFEGMKEMVAGSGPFDKARNEVAIEPGGAYQTPDVRGEASGAIQTAGGLEVDASGALRTHNGFRIEASGNVRTDVTVPLSIGMHSPLETPARAAPPQARADQARQRANEVASMREGVRQMLLGAADMENGADDMERTIAAQPTSPLAREGPARVAEMRRQAADIRRQAAEISARADRAEASA